MGYMVSALNITLNMPNIGLIIYYFVCVIILPIVLINTDNQNMLQLYLPLLLPMAAVLQASGNPNMYQNILIKDEINIVSIVSSFIIILLSFVGILWFSNSVSMNNQSLGDGILVGLLLIVLIVGFSKILIPDLIKKLNNTLIKHTDIKKNYNMYKYVIGFILLILVCLLLLSIQKMYFVSKEVIIKR